MIITHLFFMNSYSSWQLENVKKKKMQRQIILFWSFADENCQFERFEKHPKITLLYIYKKNRFAASNLSLWFMLQEIAIVIQSYNKIQARAPSFDAFGDLNVEAIFTGF